MIVSADSPHPFAQVPGAPVRVCGCGKWPDHHVHTGNRAACTCDGCSLWEPGPPIGDLAPGVPLPGGVQPGDRIRLHAEGEIPSAHATVYPLHPGNPGLLFMARDPIVGSLSGQNLREALGPVVLPRPPWWRRWWRAARTRRSR